MSLPSIESPRPGATCDCSGNSGNFASTNIALQSGHLFGWSVFQNHWSKHGRWKMWLQGSGRILSFSLTGSKQMALVSRVSSRGRGKGRVTYQESWLAIDASFSLSFDCQAFREIGSGIFLKMGILSSFSTMPGGLLCIPLKWLNSLRSLSVRCPRPICGVEEEEDISYHRPPAIKRTKPMPTIAATASIPGE